MEVGVRIMKAPMSHLMKDNTYYNLRRALNESCLKKLVYNAGSFCVQLN